MRGRRLSPWEQRIVYRRLALMIIADAKEALAGACTERAAEIAGYESTTEEALDFFRTDWAERLIAMAIPGDRPPDEIILQILENVFGGEFEVVQTATSCPHSFPRSLSRIKLQFGGRNVQLELIH